ncbi:hypothetical protein AAG570_010837 [Ranatra chinensis]|uniref:Syntaxin-binding protein 5-like n=1 Tax=Ranatra chinensis TaxID=642074 RepID=A0ABD0Z775_9HEMI
MILFLNKYFRVGRAGVDCHVWHESEAAVIQISFLINEGALVTATADDSVHLWSFRQKRPDLVHSLQFQRERITCIHLPLQSKWLYVGSERGNIHVVNIESFQLSGYVINWNKAIELSRKTHPGAVVHLSDNPLDSSKLLICFESGQLVLWDLRLRAAEVRWQSTDPLKSVSWHNDGKQFLTSHTDGTLQTFSLRQPGKPVNIQQPHAKINKDGKPESCKPIQKVEWKAARSGDQFIIFCGGLTYDTAGRAPSITIIHGRSTTVLEMEHNVVDFITLCESPWPSEVPEPYAIVVVLQNDLVVIDLLTNGFPCFESPYPMDLHECAVTCCTYLADCPSDLIPAFYSVGSRSNKRSGFSDKEWPLSGGEWTTTPCSYNEIIITGHADGSIKFWDASAGTLQILYKLKTNKVFEKPPSRSQDGADEDPFAIQLISLCPESRKLAIAGSSGYVILFKFKKLESLSETCVLEIPVAYESFDEVEGSPETDTPSRGNLTKAESTDNKSYGIDSSPLIKVKSGLQKKPPGFQALLVCLSPAPITALSINSSYGLMAYGTDTGAVVVDIVHKICLLNVTTPNLYGATDPYQRVPRSPKRTQPPDSDTDRCRSPSIDQGIEVFEGLLSGNTSPQDDVESENRWKKFNLKKQISKVDLKLKLPPKNNKRSGSVFYIEKESGDESPTSLSPDDEVPVIKESQVEEKPVRPTELPLFDEKPMRPPRKDKREKRDTRLLSVPNIKYHMRGSQGLAAIKRKINKLDSSFSRSRSSSMSSLENISSEAIQCIVFADSYTKKSEASTFPTVWLGTSLGSVLTVMLNIPPVDIRPSQPVAVAPLGTMFRLKGCILTMSFLDCNGALIPYTFESWKDENRDKRTPSRGSTNSRMSPPASSGAEVNCDRQFVAIVSEKQAMVVALPSHNIVWKNQITETDFVVKAEIISLKDSVCLVCYISSGHITAYSLPSLRPLIDTEFLPLADLSFQTRKPGIVDPMLSIWGQQMFVNEDTDQIARTFCFSNRGHGMYLCSPTEIQMFTVSTEFCASLSEMVGELFLPHDMPEPPKESFFKGLFGGGSRSLDREELFGESSSGKASRTVAKHIPGLSNLEANSQRACSEVSRAHQMVIERGEKLSQLEDRTARMMSEAETFSQSAHSLVHKYKDKKWYQL